MRARSGSCRSTTPRLRGASPQGRSRTWPRAGRPTGAGSPSSRTGSARRASIRDSSGRRRGPAADRPRGGRERARLVAGWDATGLLSPRPRPGVCGGGRQATAAAEVCRSAVQARQSSGSATSCSRASTSASACSCGASGAPRRVRKLDHHGFPGKSSGRGSRAEARCAGTLVGGELVGTVNPSVFRRHPCGLSALASARKSG
jgi:hypothetical protein